MADRTCNRCQTTGLHWVEKDDKFHPTDALGKANVYPQQMEA